MVLTRDRRLVEAEAHLLALLGGSRPFTTEEIVRCLASADFLAEGRGFFSGRCTEDGDERA